MIGKKERKQFRGRYQTRVQLREDTFGLSELHDEEWRLGFHSSLPYCLSILSSCLAMQHPAAKASSASSPRSPGAPLDRRGLSVLVPAAIFLLRKNSECQFPLSLRQVCRCLCA